MGRVINTESAGNDRNRLTKAVVLSIRELMQQQDTGKEAHDLAAFIVLALHEIAETIEPSVAAWEKRGYWVKADRFRLEWDWTVKLSGEMRQAVEGEDWPQVAQTAVKVAGKLNGIKIAQHHRLGKPWVGAWEKMKAGSTVKNGSKG